MLTKQVTMRSKVATGEDDYGQPIYTVIDHELPCYYRLSSTDDQDAVSREQIDIKVYLPTDAPVEFATGFLINDEWFDIQGPAHLQWNARLGKNEYIMVSARRAVS